MIEAIARATRSGWATGCAWPWRRSTSTRGSWIFGWLAAQARRNAAPHKKSGGKTPSKPRGKPAKMRGGKRGKLGSKKEEPAGGRSERRRA